MSAASDLREVLIDNMVEVITVFRGKDSETYLASDFEKYGDDAQPLWIRQYPGDNKPYQTIKLADSDAIMRHRELWLPAKTQKGEE